MHMIELFHGDCLDIMKDMGDNTIDMVCADPPYGTTACKWDSIIPLEPMWEHIKRITKPNAAIVMTASQPFTTKLISSNMKMFRYCWVWEKSRSTGFLNAWKMPMKSTEDICVFYRSLPTYNPILENKDPKYIKLRSTTGKQTDCYGSFDRAAQVTAQKCPIDKNMPQTILRFNNAQRYEHPTQKPVDLMEYLIKTYTNKDETVLDFCMGSGTTGIASYNTNRNFIGIELEEEYYNIAKERIAKHQVQLKLF